MRINAYGRYLEVLKAGQSWEVFDIGNEGKKRPARDVRIPPSVGPGEVVNYLADLLHEYASARNPDVRVCD